MMVILPQLVKLVDHKTQSLKFLRKQKISLASRILDLEKTASQIEGRLNLVISITKENYKK